MTPHSVNVIADTSRMPNSFRQKPHDRIADWRTSGQGLAALRDFGPANDRIGSCVTSADVSIGGAQLYER
jgi:hypothetical protein